MSDVPSHYRPAIEALLLAADRPLHADELADVLSRVDGDEASPAVVRDLLERWRSELLDADGGFLLVEVGAGWELRTRGAWADYVHALYRRKPIRLGRAQLEVLAIIAYRQPCTRADIDEIRGVDSSGALRQVLERELVRILGKADDVGRPLVYGTTPRFLSFFGLKSLAELPTLREFSELAQENFVRLQGYEETLQANETEAAVIDENQLLIPFVGRSEVDEIQVPETEPTSADKQ